MMNYLWDFSQSEMEKYFDWIINAFKCGYKNMLQWHVQGETKLLSNNLNNPALVDQSV